MIYKLYTESCNIDLQIMRFKIWAWSICHNVFIDGTYLLVMHWVRWWKQTNNLLCRKQGGGQTSRRFCALSYNTYCYAIHLIENPLWESNSSWHPFHHALISIYYYISTLSTGLLVDNSSNSVYTQFEQHCTSPSLAVLL